MKLLNILSITVMGTLFAVGCSSTTTITSDSGPSETGGTTDTGVKTDTGTPADTGSTPTDTGVDPEKVCQDCVTAKCSAQVTACNASDATKKACQDIITCLVACTTAACQDACITDSMSTEAKEFVRCVYVDNCKAECTSGG